ncbi:MAG TPA: hypothetical protein VMM55_10845 [Thermohalobaculum sp.]|nr:hypothetical protein [Thermohalobaculum sp.]
MLRLSLLVSLGAAMIAVMVLWFAFGGSGPAVEARYDLENCRRVDLRDSFTGKLLAGVSDMALLPDGDTLVLAALDRTDQTLPFGGLFGVSLFELERGAPVLEVEAIVKPYDLAGGVYPEGIDYDASSGRLALINNVGGEGTAVIDVIERQDELWSPVARHMHDAFCRASDVAFDFGGNLLVTRDRAICHLSVMDAMPFYPTGLMLVVTPDGTVRATEDRFFLPNGIVIGPTGLPIVAEMRAEKLTGDIDRPMPGGPDNLTIDEDGGVVAALHPSLWKFFFYLNGFAFSSPSRVVRFDPGSSQLEILLDDPGGDLLSAVGVALLEEERLYLGSVTDDGIGICEPS